MAGYAARYPAVKFWCGDSRFLLASALEQLDMPCLIWLDAHPDVAQQDIRPEGACPVLDELAAVNASRHAAQHVVLIDDAQTFRDASGAMLKLLRLGLANGGKRAVYECEDVLYGEPLP